MADAKKSNLTIEYVSGYEAEEPMKIRVIYLLTAILGVLLWTNLPGASAADFYEGTTVRFVVGSAAGGGYDNFP